MGIANLLCMSTEGLPRRLSWLALSIFLTGVLPFTSLARDGEGKVSDGGGVSCRVSDGPDGAKVYQFTDSAILKIQDFSAFQQIVAPRIENLKTKIPYLAELLSEMAGEITWYLAPCDLPRLEKEATGEFYLYEQTAVQTAVSQTYDHNYIISSYKRPLGEVRIDQRKFGEANSSKTSELENQAVLIIHELVLRAVMSGMIKHDDWDFPEHVEPMPLDAALMARVRATSALIFAVEKTSESDLVKQFKAIWTDKVPSGYHFYRAIGGQISLGTWQTLDEAIESASEIKQKSDIYERSLLNARKKYWENGYELFILTHLETYKKYCENPLSKKYVKYIRSNGNEWEIKDAYFISDSADENDKKQINESLDRITAFENLVYRVLDWGFAQDASLEHEVFNRVRDKYPVIKLEDEKVDPLREMRNLYYEDLFRIGGGVSPRLLEKNIKIEREGAEFKTVAQNEAISYSTKDYLRAHDQCELLFGTPESGNLGRESWIRRHLPSQKLSGNQL